MIPPIRAREILAAGNKAFGNYSRPMTTEEIVETHAAWMENPRGTSSFYSTICGFAFVGPRRELEPRQRRLWDL